MKGRIKLNVHNNLQDLQPINPHLFDELPPTDPGKTQNKLYQSESISSTKTKRRRQIKHKRVSLQQNLFDEIAQSAKQKLKADDNSYNEVDSDMSSMNQAIKNQHNHVIMATRKTLSKQKKKLELKQIIKRQKIKNICNKFIDKLSRNNAYSNVIHFNGFKNEQKTSFLLLHGFEINKIIDNTLALLSIIQIISIFLAYTIILVFPQVQDTVEISTLYIFSLIFYLVQIAYNCVTVKANTGKKLITLQEILHFYANTSMFIDVASFLILLIDYQTNLSFMHFVRLFIFARIPQCLEKMDKLEAYFIKNYYNDQYWSLLKVVLFNFCFAHILAVILTSMANLNQSTNWQIVKGIYDAAWFQRYIWSYYWGTTIMLTIGFGDITATTYQEASCLIVIQIFSVMCLAYNINSLGTLINNIRSQDIQKGKNYKTFKQLSDKYNLPSELQWKINQHIEESVNIRKKFNLEEENQFLQKLPSDLKREYLKESNRSIFFNLPFFCNLMDKTLYALAQNIQMSISHPQQTLRRLDDEYNLLILRQGEIGFTPKRRNCNFNDMIIDRVKLANSKKPFLLGLQFLTRRRSSFEIKSLEYSVIYKLGYDKLISILKESQMDYLHFCFLRDKNKTIIDEFEVYPCEYCPGKHHTKFTCPKLHYTPLRQMAIYREQSKERTGINKRDNDNQKRILEKKVNSLLNYKIINKRPESDDKQLIHKQNTSLMIRINQMKKRKATFSEDTMSVFRMDQFFLKNASQIIKSEFNQFRMAQNFDDDVWNINCDRMRNFKDYFPEDNPINLGQNFSVEERLKFISENFQSASFITHKSPTMASIAKVSLKPSTVLDSSKQI